MSELVSTANGPGFERSWTLKVNPLARMCLSCRTDVFGTGTVLKETQLSGLRSTQFEPAYPHSLGKR